MGRINMITRLRTIASALTLLVGAGLATAQTPSFTPLAGFGGVFTGWRQPGESIPGDSVAGPYPYLGTVNLERGLAYNPTTGNLVLVSRTNQAQGTNVRILSGTTGADVGFLDQTGGTVTGGTFLMNMVGVAQDGAIYVSNLQTNVNTGQYRIYRWGSEASAIDPTPYFAGTISGFTGTPRLGDSIDVTGSGANTTIVAGVSGTVGYAVVTDSGGAGVATAVPTFSPPGPVAGDFRLGITFGANANEVWGKQTSAPLRVTTYSGSTGAAVASSALVSAGEMAMDYVTVAGIPYLVTLDANSSIIRTYNVSNPAAPLLVIGATGTTTSGPLVANGNATGSIAIGPVDNNLNSFIVYAMSTNQGIQAATIVVPEPATVLLIAGASLAGVQGVRRLRRKSA
jgi:hypothetical protein